MHRTDVAVIGAGPAGLAMSHCLARHGVEHVVLERGRVGERWAGAPWRALRLITPNRLTRLPGHAYAGPSADGFMTAGDLATHLAAYAAAASAPVLTGAEVFRLARGPAGYLLETALGVWSASSVVIATGACESPRIPELAADLPASIAQLSPATYRSADALPGGGVLVVGASSSGVQIARELAAAGRRVILAAGRHTRMVRRYRGRDIFAWLDDAGVLDDPWTSAASLEAARRQPSLQLAWDRALDLGQLAASGVQIAGRVHGSDGGRVFLGANLAADAAAAESRLRRTLGRIDAHIAMQGLDAPPDPDARSLAPLLAARAGEIDLVREDIRTIIWATGYRTDYPWLEMPVRDADGNIRHDGGVTAAPGLFVLGLPFLRRRSSGFLAGMGRDAEALSELIAAQLGRRAA